MHPQLIARSLAEQLRADPVAAAQVREFIPTSELLDLLGLDPVEILQSLPDAEAQPVRESMLEDLDPAEEARIAYDYLTNYVADLDVRKFYDAHDIPTAKL